MVTVETYIKHRNCFIKIEPDTDIEKGNEFLVS